MAISLPSVFVSGYLCWCRLLALRCHASFVAPLPTYVSGVLLFRSLYCPLGWSPSISILGYDLLRCPITPPLCDCYIHTFTWLQPCAASGNIVRGGEPQAVRIAAIIRAKIREIFRHGEKISCDGQADPPHSHRFFFFYCTTPRSESYM